jgi:hypothetical protein
MQVMIESFAVSYLSVMGSAMSVLYTSGLASVFVNRTVFISLRGLRHEIEFKYFEKMHNLGLIKSLYLVLNFEDGPLIM